MQDLGHRLAEAANDAARLGVLLEFGRQTALSQRAAPQAEVYFREAIELARKVGSPEDLAAAAVAASEFYRNSGNMARGLECAEIVQEVADSAGKPIRKGQYFYLKGRISEEQYDYTRARDCYERCLSIWRDAGFTKGIPAPLNQLGSLAALQGHEAEALERYQECLRMNEELDDVAGQVFSRMNIGWALQRLGRWEDAAECYYRNLALAEQHNLPVVHANTLNCLGELYLERGKTAKAIDAFRMVQQALGQDEAVPHPAREALCNLGLAFHRQRDFAGAAQAYLRALEMVKVAADRRGQALVLWRMAELALDQGQADRCAELAERSSKLAREIPIPSEEAQASRVLGLLHAARGEHATARACFEHAMDLLHDLEEGVDLARVRYHYGRYLLAQGQTEPALTLLNSA
jgi:tetratricopeptide (TPR) repeat protein